MRFHNEDGQALVEFALVLPVLILLLGGIIDFGWIFGNQILANNACRDTARYTAVHYHEITVAGDVNEVAVKTAAQTRIETELPASFKNINVDMTTPIIENINLSLSADIDLLTPILSTILGQTYTIQTNYVMRVE
jgi:hypothetical protein